MVNAGFFKVPHWIFEFPQKYLRALLQLIYKASLSETGEVSFTLPELSQNSGNTISEIRTLLVRMRETARCEQEVRGKLTWLRFRDDFIRWGAVADSSQEDSSKLADFQKEEKKGEKKVAKKRVKEEKKNNQEEEEVRNNGYHLSKQRKDHFISAGKVEVIDDVFMTEKELRILEVLHGERVVNWALVQVSDWASNPNPDKKGRPSYKSFHEKEDHYRVVKNQIDRAKANGFGPFKKEAMCD